MRDTLIKYITLLTIVLNAFAVSGQNDAQFTQYYEVPSYYNPGAIGCTDLLRIRGGMRMQWVGIDNAPRTFTAVADMPFKFINRRWGVGLVMQQGSRGLYSDMNIGAQIAYKKRLLKGEMTIGVRVGFIDQAFKGSEVFLPDNDDYHEGTDDAIPTNDLRGNALDLGLGIYYTHRLFWAGLSCTHLNSPSISLNADSGEGGTEKNYQFNVGRTLYFIAGSNIPIKNSLFEVIPSLLVKSDLTFTTAEVTARLRYNKFLSGGLSYRYNDAVSLTLAAEIKGFYVGYSYDYPVSAIAKASSGSHELFAGYSLKLDFSEKNKNKHKSIRIM